MIGTSLHTAEIKFKICCLKSKKSVDNVNKVKRNIIENAEIIIELSKDAHSLYLRQTPKEKAELMKLLTIELLFDGENLIITPHSAFSALLNLRKSHKLEMAGVEPASIADKN